MVRKEDCRYYVYPDELMSASGYVSPSGEKETLTPLAKNVYVYTLNFRNKSISDKGYHSETQDVIAKSVASDYKVVGKILRSFVSSGILKAKKVRPEGKGPWRWFYFDVCENLEFF